MGGPRYSAEDLLERLVAFDTTSHKSNLPLLSFVEDYLAQHGIASVLVRDATGEKANLFATIGPAGRPGVCLSGHVDVVPVDGQSWTSDPFRLTRRNGRLYGRGTTDMKGFVACVLASVPVFKARQLETPIHIALSHDEEIGCVGVRSLIERLGADLVQPKIVIVGEPTSMAVVDAHKGPARWELELTGRAAHSSMAPLGVNAIAYMGEVIAELSRRETSLAQTVRDDRFDPPFPTLQVTRIQGGTASNIVPVSCIAGFEIRALPGVDVEAFERSLVTFLERDVVARMRKVAPEAQAQLRRVNYVPPFAATANSQAVALALLLAKRNETHAVSYATEAGLFQDGGASAVVCGPGDIAQAHTANEFIEPGELDRCMAFLARLADWAQAGAEARVEGA